MVAGSAHGHHIEEHVPPWWGIITAELTEGAVDFYLLRGAKENPCRSWERKLSLLWRPELAHIQELNHMHAYKDRSKLFVIRKLLEKVPEALLSRQVSEELFERDYTAIGETIKSYKKSRKKVNRHG